jgi:adenylate cyclase
VRTSNLTIVFTDIKGFTERTGRQSYAENQRMLRLHDALLVPVFRAFEGRLIKAIGDAFLVVFESPTKAVLCGAAIQDRLCDYNRKAQEGERIEVRVAINLGEVREEKGDVFGEPVNIAARVEGLAEAGEVVFTEAVYLAMNRAEVPADEFGVHELKGISTPIRLWRVRRGGGELPYGGLGLSRAGRLPSTEPAELSKERELVPQLLQRAGDLQRAIAPVAERLSGGALVPRARAELLPLWLRTSAVLRARPWIAAALPVLLFGAGYLLLRGDAVERALERGDVKEARRLVAKEQAGPEKAFHEGRIDEARGSLSQAAARYQEAARGGERRGFKRLVSMTRETRCAAREASARALGELGDLSARGALEELEESSFPDEGEDHPISALFGCSSKRAARDALARLKRQ